MKVVGRTWLQLDGAALGQEDGDDARKSLVCNLHAVLEQGQDVEQLRLFLELASGQLLFEPARVNVVHVHDCTMLYLYKT